MNNANQASPPASSIPRDESGPDTELLDRLQARKPSRMKYYVGAGVLTLLLGGGLTMCGIAASSAARWETAQVERGDLDLTVIAVGTLEPTHTASVGSDQSGVVASVLVSENDPVVQDQPLAELDTRTLVLQVRQAESGVTSLEASVAQARVARDDARVQSARTRRMTDQGAASPAEAENAEVLAKKADAALEAAQAQLAQARVSLDMARRNLDQATIRSPLNGIVMRRDVEPGQTVVSALQAATLFEIAADLTQMRLPVEVDEAEVGRVVAGQAATFTVPAFVGRSFSGTVDKIHLAPKKGTQVVSYIAELVVQNDDLALRPGMTATARIVTDELKDVLELPAEALRFDPDKPLPPEGSHVWRVAGQKLEAVPVTILGNDGAKAAVKADNLEPGTEIAIAEMSAAKRLAAKKGGP